MHTLSVVGAGHVGKTIATLWQRNGSCKVVGVLNTSLESSRAAVRTIGAGHAASSFEDLPQADIYLLSVGDDAITGAMAGLRGSRDLSGRVVFHTSGSTSSSVLRGGGSRPHAASVHPVKSFADVEASIKTFSGTFCGYEGDESALAIILPKFEAVGGVVFPIDPSRKTLYHTAAVFSMNYLVALIDVGLKCYGEAGVGRDLAMKLLQPILTSAVENVFRLGTVDALTGPISRGDVAVVERQLEDLQGRDRGLEVLYSLLGQQALSLAAQSGRVPARELEQLSAALRAHGG